MKRPAVCGASWHVLAMAIAGACPLAPAAAQEAPAAAQEAAAAPAAQQFDINAFDVTGVTRFDPDQIATILYPFTGPARSNDDAEAARKAIQDAYAARGFEAVVVELPVQPDATFRQGIVTIAVSESPLGQVLVSGGKYHSEGRVLENVPSLVPGQPIDLRALQRDVAAANRFPDRTITPTFKPSTTGGVDVELRVKDELPIHASVEINNDNSPSTTRTRISSSARFTNLGGVGHTLSATYIYAPERKSDSEVISGSYSIPFIGTPWTLLVFGYKSNSNIAALGGTNVLGNGYQVGVRATYKLPSDGTYQAITFGPDFKDFQQDITVGGVPAGSAPIRYIPITAEYALSGGDENTSFGVNLGGTFGFRAINRTTCVEVVVGLPCQLIDQFRGRELDANENFVHLNLGATYERAFKGDLVAAYRLNAQIADSHLITNEQFSIGGLTNVRGYYQSEAVGDDGFSQSLELRSPSAATLFGSVVDELRVYGFVDMGWVRVRRVLAEQQDQFRLLGVGGGARLRLFDLFSGEMSIGVPLRDGPISSAGDPRAIFVVRGEF
ncbi:ShlB/FhaC/HecB family hemolysin secretion/activation protein [Sphingomonas sp.]|uniref:ShlB/FhaC/HecB family hemolysin secretion/activation protein n=1 Tax=Sphingomonas sp. TaxID=28214 RepID=UPI0035C79C3D